MQIDITALNQNQKDELILDEAITFQEKYFENQEIKDLKNVHLSGRIELNEMRNPVVVGELTGTMVILDSISLEPVDYQFRIEIDEIIEENSENFENTLDILDILWQNIVLEVPLRFTTVKDTSKLKGEGWRLLSEEETMSNNPFEDLKSMFGKE